MSTSRIILQRCRVACRVALALTLFLLPHNAKAYQFIYEASGGANLPVAWRSLPVPFIADVNPATVPTFQTTVTSAFAVWNNVTTAQNIFGTVTNSAVDFTGANFGTAWGVMPAEGDANHEIVCDVDGTALAAVGSAGALGRAMRQHRIIGGEAHIVDGLFILNCQTPQSANFNHLGTMVHELGHVIGLRHSSAYLPDAGRLLPLAIGNAPTMYPYSIPNNDAASATLEADDIAGISDLYPEPTVATGYATLSGTVTRCGSTDPVHGVNVRAVSTSNSLVQITRYTGFNGNQTGRYEMKVPAGTYKLIIEVMSLPVGSMALLTTADDDFASEYRSEATIESNCTEDMPDTGIDIAAAGGASVTAQDFKTNPVELAFVVDDTGSMGPEIAAVRAALTAQIQRLAAQTTRPYPNTAIVSFKDDVTLRKVSRDPVVLQGIVNGLFASGGGDCPESSNAALMTAGRLLRDGAQVLLFTDADSRSDGPSAASVAALYTSKGLRQSTLLSGSCTTTISYGGTDPDASDMDPQHSQNPGYAEDRLPTDPPLGVPTSVQTFSSIAAATGGVMVAIPGIKTGNATETARYRNVGTNIAVAATLPTVSTVLPGDGARGTTVDVAITGANTNFQSASVLSFSGTGITVNFRLVQSPTQMVANITVAPDATLGFRDVTVTTDLGGSAVESALGVGAFNVIATPTGPTVISVSPTSAALGSTLDVTIRGSNTSFSAASVPLFCVFASCTSTANRDTLITVNSVTATSPTTLVANITIAPNATVAYRSVSVVTGAQTATETVTGPFLVTATQLNIPRLTSVTPSSANVGQTLTLNVVGQNTTFSNGVSALSISGAGVTVNNTTVTSATTLSASITIAAGAIPGFRDVFVTTGGSTATLLSGLNIVGGPPTAQPPTGLYAASVVGNVVTLRWNAPLTGLVPTNFVLEGGVLAGQVLASIPTNDRAPIFTFVAPTGSFFVRMHTMSGVERSGPSNEIQIHVNVPVTPSAPASLLGVRNGSAITLAWRNTYDGGEPSDMFLDVSGAFNGTLPLPKGDSFNFDAVPNGTYTLRLRAVNAGGASPSSNPVTLSFPGACAGPPLTPTNFLGYRIGNTVYVVWNPAATGPAPTGFMLNVGGSYVASLPTAGRALSGTVGAGSYQLSVIATNACGASAATPVQTVVVP